MQYLPCVVTLLDFLGDVIFEDKSKRKRKMIPLKSLKMQKHFYENISSTFTFYLLKKLWKYFSLK